MGEHPEHLTMSRTSNDLSIQLIKIPLNLQNKTEAPLVYTGDDDDCAIAANSPHLKSYEFTFTRQNVATNINAGISKSFKSSSIERFHFQSHKNRKLFIDDGMAHCCGAIS